MNYDSFYKPHNLNRKRPSGKIDLSHEIMAALILILTLILIALPWIKEFINK